jgi:hypothetical protein
MRTYRDFLWRSSRLINRSFHYRLWCLPYTEVLVCHKKQVEVFHSNLSIERSWVLFRCWVSLFLTGFTSSRVFSSAMFFKKILWSFQGSLFRFPVSHSDDVVSRPNAHQSATSVRTTWYSVRMLFCQSIIRPDKENFPSRRPSVSRSFEQFKIASVRT